MADKPEALEPLKAYFPLYFMDFERDTRKLSDDLKMKYLRLLNQLYYEGGWIEDEDGVIAQAAGIERVKLWRKKVALLRVFLTAENGFVTQKRVLAILRKAAETRQARADAGRKGGKANASGEAKQVKVKAKGSPTQQPVESSPLLAAAAEMVPKGAKGWVLFIKIMDAAVAQEWGPEHARPWPAQGDDGTAQGWESRGWTPEQVAASIARQCAKKKANGQRPPGTLAYFTPGIEDDLARATQARSTAEQPRPRGGGEAEAVRPLASRETLLATFERLNDFGALAADAWMQGLTEDAARAELEARAAAKNGKMH